MEVTTPDQVIAELNRLITEGQRGINALYDCEVKVAELDAQLEMEHARAILGATGTAVEKQATAKIAVNDLQLQLAIAKAEQNRVKAKIRAIESAQVAVSVIAKQVELMWRHA